MVSLWLLSSMVKGELYDQKNKEDITIKLDVICDVNVL